MDNLFAIKDIAPPIENLPSTAIWPWIAAAVVIAAFLSFKLLRKKEPLPLPEPSVALSPLQVALRELDALLAEELIANGSTKQFFTRLNIILRYYLTKTFNLPITSQTTSELLRSDSCIAEMSEDCQKYFATFLKECDLFKFANIKSKPNIAHDALTACRNLIVTIAEGRGEQ